MLYNADPYTMRVEETEEILHYYIIFKDGQAVTQEIEVSKCIYLAFCHFAKHERRLKRWDERYTEQSDLSDATIYSRALYHPKSVEESIISAFKDERIRVAVLRLPETQRRRFLLSHYGELTYEQIAKIEGCSKVAVKYTIDKAKMSITKELKDFYK